ncbi:MAG: hypothetical protein OXM61_15195 [Candidatus Poribacteria bacterium]|nr:hypothetical protein [Candidatus Poribacteria bacterium]
MGWFSFHQVVYGAKFVGRVERSETRQYQGFKAKLAGFTGKSKEQPKQVLKIVFQFQHVGFRKLYPTYKSLLLPVSRS